MRTRGLSTWLTLGVVIVASFLLIVGNTTGANSRVPPADVERLGLSLRSIASAPIDEAAAIQRGIDTFGGQPGDGSSVDAYLVAATDPRSLTLGPRAISDGAIWIVRLSGLDLYFPGPPAEDGSVSVGHTAHFAYVLVDAVSGEPLDMQFWE